MPVVSSPSSTVHQPTGDKQHRRDHNTAERILSIGILGDIFSIVAALLFSYWSRFLVELPKVLGLPSTPAPGLTFSDYVHYIIFGTFTYVLCVGSFGAYHRALLLNWQKASVAVVRASIVWGVLFLAIAFTFRMQPPVSRGFVGTGIFASILCLLAWRWIFHFSVRREAVARILRKRALLVGWTPEATRISVALWQHRTDPIEIAGYVDFPASATLSDPPPNVPYQGNHIDLTEIIHQQQIDTVLLTNLNVSTDQIMAISNLCEKELVHFKIIPPFFPVLISGLHLEMLSGFPVLSVSALPLDWLPNKFLKRAIDILGSVVGIVMATPIIIACSALIYRESPGSVFFSQERVGQGGRRFKMRKLRTMKLGAERSDNLNQSTLRNDPRLLRIGAIMRRWNLDELPQFWNVFVGEMSLVGPRPERVYHSHRLRDIIPHYNVRYMAPPGLTGWAQVNGLRGDTDLHERIRYDLYYMENWSPWFDLKIMLLTLFRSKNAY